MKPWFLRDVLEPATADSGYCSEKNLLYLKENGIRSYIKLQDNEKRKARAYKEDIGKHYNMIYAGLYKYNAEKTRSVIKS